MDHHSNSSQNRGRNQPTENHIYTEDEHHDGTNLGCNQVIVTQSNEKIRPHKKQVQDRAIIIHVTRSSEHKSNFTFQVSIRRVYENAHRISKVVTLQYGESKSMNKDMENHPYLNHSKQKTEIIKAHVLHPESSFLHMTRERDVQILDPKELVDKYLGTQDLDTHKALNLS
jgi:hypothetical protein